MSVLGVLQRWSHRPFEYGVTDCCQLAGELVAERFGRNPMKEFSYSDKRSAMRVIAEHGGLENAVTATLGEPVSVDQAEDGDVLLVESEQGPAVATCFQGQAIVLTPNGPVNWPLATATRCWKP